MAVNPLTADTESFAEGVAKRQAIMRGSELVGQRITQAGLASIVYGSKRINLPRTSYLLSRDTRGTRQPYKFTDKSLKYERPAPARGNKWGANYEKDIRSKSGTNRPSSRTSIRSRPAVLGGRVLVVSGQLIPILGTYYVVDDILANGTQSDIVQDAKYQSDLSFDAINTGLNFGKSFYSSPIGKIATTVALSKLGIF